MKEKLVGLIFLGILAIQIPSHSQEEDSFNVWLDALRDEAESRGFSEKSINLAFSEITEPIQRIISNDRNQAEVVQTYADYLDTRVSDWRKVTGIELMNEHQNLLQEIALEYGVQPRFIVAIWGIETNFGTSPIKEPVFSTLATLAYDKRRADFYRAQFFAALTILDSGFPPYEKWKVLDENKRLSDLLRRCQEWMVEMDGRYGDAPDYAIFADLAEMLDEEV